MPIKYSQLQFATEMNGGSRMDCYDFPMWLLDYDISSDAKILFVYIYNLVKESDDESIYITSSDIEKNLHLTQFKRRKVLSELKESGLIKRINRGTKTRTYVCIPEIRRELKMEDDNNE